MERHIKEEQEVCTVEQGLFLKDHMAGIVPKLYWWNDPQPDGDYLRVGDRNMYLHGWREICPAYTLTEMLLATRHGNRIYVGYANGGGFYAKQTYGKLTIASTPAEALGELLVQGIKKGKIKMVEEPVNTGCIPQEVLEAYGFRGNVTVKSATKSIWEVTLDGKKVGGGIKHGRHASCAASEAVYRLSMKHYREKIRPKYVKMDNVVLVYQKDSDRYYERQGAWHLNYNWEGTQVVGFAPGMPWLHGKPMVPITENEWRNFYGVYKEDE